MRMVSLIDAVFWGVLLITAGVLLIVRKYVPFNLPVVRILVALVFVYLGVRIIVHGPTVRDENTVVFGSRTTLAGETTGSRDYNIIFGSGDIDFTGLPGGRRDPGGQRHLRLRHPAAESRHPPADPHVVRLRVRPRPGWRDGLLRRPHLDLRRLPRGVAGPARQGFRGVRQPFHPSVIDRGP